MHKSIKKSLYLCAAALMISGVVAPSVSNEISASAHSRYAVSRYRHKSNVHKYDTKRIAHLRRVHSYHLRMENKAKRSLVNHKKSLGHYNHLLRVHKRNRKMINNLIRSKRKLIRMIKNDQRGIARYAKYVESDEHQINMAYKQSKRNRYHIRRDLIGGNTGASTGMLWKTRGYYLQGYRDGINGRRAILHGSGNTSRAYNNGYAKGLAKFSQKRAQNRYNYLRSISYLAGYDDGYHNNHSNYDNFVMARLLKSNRTYMSNYRAGYSAGNKAYVNMQNHTRKDVIPKVIIPNNFNKVVKPNVIPNPNADQNNPYSSSKDKYWYSQGYKFAYNHTGMYVDSHLSNALDKAGNNKDAFLKGIAAGTKARISWDSSHHNGNSITYNDNLEKVAKRYTIISNDIAHNSIAQLDNIYSVLNPVEQHAIMYKISREKKSQLVTISEALNGLEKQATGSAKGQIRVLFLHSQDNIREITREASFKNIN